MGQETPEQAAPVEQPGEQPASKPLKVFVGLAINREITVQTAQALYWGFVQAAAKEGIEVAIYVNQGDGIARARSRTASVFLAKTDADVLVHVDYDIVFAPADLVKLVKRCASGYDVIGGFYNCRSNRGDAAVLLSPDQQVIFDSTAEPVEIEFASTGFLAAHRRVYERLAETLPLVEQHPELPELAFWPFYWELIVEHEGWLRYLSEDWSLCYRARQAGFKIWLDPSIRLGHLGTAEFKPEDFLFSSWQPLPTVPLAITRTADRRIAVAWPNAKLCAAVMDAPKGDEAWEPLTEQDQRTLLRLRRLKALLAEQPAASDAAMLAALHEGEPPRIAPADMARIRENMAARMLDAPYVGASAGTGPAPLNRQERRRLAAQRRSGRAG